MQVTLRNDFHRSSISAEIGRDKHGLYITDAEAGRAITALCGMTDCTCSRPALLCTRGPQEIDVSQIRGVLD
jgi:hypothetical protein